MADMAIVLVSAVVSVYKHAERSHLSMLRIAASFWSAVEMLQLTYIMAKAPLRDPEGGVHEQARMLAVFTHNSSLAHILFCAITVFGRCGISPLLKAIITSTHMYYLAGQPVHV